MKKTQSRRNNISEAIKTLMKLDYDMQKLSLVASVKATNVNRKAKDW